MEKNEQNETTKTIEKPKITKIKLSLIILFIIVFIFGSAFLTIELTNVIDDEHNVVTSKTITTTKSTATLGSYKDMEVEYTPVTFSEEEYNSYIENARIATKDYVEKKDGVVESGDVIVITYNGWLKENTAKDGETQEYDQSMTTTDEFELNIGSNTYIPGFEDALIGKNVGETTKIELTFPSDYGSENYDGKDAIFEVNLIAKRTYAENPSDEKVMENLVPNYFQDATKTEFKTFEEFKVWLKKDMESYYEMTNNQAKENAVIQKYISLATNVTFDKTEEEKAKEDVIASYEKEAEQYQVDTETLATSYYGFTATDEKTAFDSMVEDAIKSKLEYDTILSKLVIEENIKLNDGDVDKYVEYLADLYSISTDEVKSAYVYELDGKQIDNTVLLEKETLYRKAIQILIDNSNFVELKTN